MADKEEQRTGNKCYKPSSRMKEPNSWVKPMPKCYRCGVMNDVVIAYLNTSKYVCAVCYKSSQV